MSKKHHKTMTRKKNDDVDIGQVALDLCDILLIMVLGHPKLFYYALCLAGMGVHDILV